MKGLLPNADGSASLACLRITFELLIMHNYFFILFHVQEEAVIEMQRLLDVKRKQFEEQRALEAKEKAEAAEKKAKKDKAKKNKK